MASKKYIATAKGYVDGRIIQEGEAFEHEFVEIVREGKPGVGNVVPIKRDEKGNAITKPCAPPSWARPADGVEFVVAKAADGKTEDLNFEAMSVAELKAYAASKGIDVTPLKAKDDIIKGIKEEDDPKKEGLGRGCWNGGPECW